MLHTNWKRIAALAIFTRASLAAYVLVGALFGQASAAAQAGVGAVITSPSEGDSLQGQVQIVGTAGAPDFVSAELAFAFASDTTDTWFEIKKINGRIQDAQLGQWDTTAVSDGEYVLRLRVASLNGPPWDATVPVQVRNYTAPRTVPTAASETRLPVLQVPTPMRLLQLQTSAAVRPSTPTSFPANPAATTPSAIYVGFWQGALLIGGLFLAGAFILARRQP